MVRLVTITVPKSKGETIISLLLRLFEHELIFQPQVQGQSCLDLNGGTILQNATEQGSRQDQSFATTVVDGVHNPSTNQMDDRHTVVNNTTSLLLQTNLLYFITFKTKDKQLQDVLAAFEKLGVGKEFGQIDVVSLVLSKPSVASLFYGPVVDTTATVSSPTSSIVTPRDVDMSISLRSDGVPITTASLSGRVRNNSMDDSAANSVEHSASQEPAYSFFFRNTSAASGRETDGKNKNKKTRKRYRVSDRMTIEEIASFIDDGNHLTFNYLALLACASMIAGAGLLGDSATTVIASMLVSPLMGPILSITFGLAVRDLNTIRKGLRNEIIGIILSFVTGLLIGTAGAFAYPPHYRSGEMVGRGTASNLIYGFVVAFASGIAVVLGITMGGVNAIVGTAISASLLPPIVNSGMCMAMAILYHIQQSSLDDDKVYEDSMNYYVYSGISFCLFAVNFVVIVIVGYITFRYIKQVYPVKEVRDSNMKSAVELV